MALYATCPVCLCRRTHFMISSLHMTKVMVLIMIMTHEEGLWISMQPVCLCRRTPFMISSLHVTEVMMLIMIMTTRRGCGSLCNLYASAVGHLS